MEPAPPIERYKIAYLEYRAEVALGNERQKLFIGHSARNMAAAKIVALHLPREVAERLLAPEPQGPSHTQPSAATG